MLLNGAWTPAGATAHELIQRFGGELNAGIATLAKGSMVALTLDDMPIGTAQLPPPPSRTAASLASRCRRQRLPYDDVSVTAARAAAGPRAQLIAFGEGPSVAENAFGFL